MAWVSICLQDASPQLRDVPYVTELGGPWSYNVPEALLRRRAVRADNNEPL